MNLSSVIDPQDVIPDLSAATKPALIDMLSEHAARRTGVDAKTIRAALLGRERLGSTGIGDGVAVPHAPVAGLGAPFAALAILRKAIDFEAVDDQPVDIVFLLLSPAGGSGDYLKILAAVARRTRDQKTLNMLRSATTAEDACSVLVGPAG